jgi:hypothetical protein
MAWEGAIVRTIRKPEDRSNPRLKAALRPASDGQAVDGKDPSSRNRRFGRGFFASSDG